ncbi:unnamed protein product, partial [Ixodes hexagonus]
VSARCAFFTGPGGGCLRWAKRGSSDGEAIVRAGRFFFSPTCWTAAGGQHRRRRPRPSARPASGGGRRGPSRVRRSVTTCLTGRPPRWPSINLAIGASGTADTPVIGPKPDLGGAHRLPLFAARTGRRCGRGDRRSRHSACV